MKMMNFNSVRDKVAIVTGASRGMAGPLPSALAKTA